MTNTILILLLSFLINAAAFAQTPGFGAFVYNRVLYVTVLGDQCNLYFADLAIGDRCEEECEAELLVFQTLRACEKKELIPKNFEIWLTDAGVPPEARVLILTYTGERKTVQIR